MQAAPVLFEQRQHIGIITLNRPDNRNSMTAELLQSFGDVTREVAGNPELRCVIITGRGSCFSAGADFRSIVQRDDRDGYRLPHEKSFAMYEPFLRVLELEVPTIGALNGHAVGGGFGLALLCDMRIGAENAKFGANFAKLGLHPGLGISYLLPRLIGVPRACEMLFTGRLIAGTEAAANGLFSEAVPAADVWDRAWALADQIARNAPLAIRTMKRGFYQALDWRPREAAYAEALAQAFTLETEDVKEGIAALLDKRAPEFHGR
jgi:enoyl-CoA hydratase/carnithine racemase